MKTKGLTLLSITGFSLAVAAGSVHAGTVSGLTSTGETYDQGGLLTPGSSDTSYTLISYPSPESTVLTAGYPFVTEQTGAGPNTYPYTNFWIAEQPTAEWISPQSSYTATYTDNDAPGVYEYQTTFDITGSPSSTIITGAWAGDDDRDYITINGYQFSGTGTDPSYANLLSFTIPSAELQDGTNTLDFFVTNGPNNTSGNIGNPAGLMVEFPATGAPEPSTVGAYSVGCLMLLGFMVRKKRLS